MIARLLQGLWVALLLAVAASALTVAHFLGPTFETAVGPVLGVALAVALGALPWLLLHPAVVINNFVWSRVFGDPVSDAQRLSWRRAFAMLDREIDASIRGVWLANPFLSKRPAPSGRVGPATRDHAILFVHGYLCNRAVFHPFMADAASRGYRCEAVTLANPFGPIEGHVAAIDGAIASLSPSGTPVFIVAHSMGGLVVRSALRVLDPSRILHLVTLGTPHHGTWNARFARGPASRRMRLHSPWLVALAAEESVDVRARITSIASVHDEIVYPQSTSFLDGADNVFIAGCGHVDLLYAPEVRDIVFARLDARGQLPETAS